MTRKTTQLPSHSLHIESLDPRLMLDGTGFLDPVFYQPTPYLSEADTPAGFVPEPDCPDCVVGLETFEDGTLDFGLELSTGQIIDPGFRTGIDRLTDSVDSDDGVIDGTGQTNEGGYSYFTFTDSITVTLPSLMQSAGLVWTDGDPNLTNVVFEAFDENGDSLGTVDAGPIADGSIMGTTPEDRFFGVTYGDGVTTGVTSIRITNVGAPGIEIDHIQFANCSECCQIDLELDKSVDVTSGEAGDIVTWTIEVTNNPDTAQQAATGVQIQDVLPDGVRINGINVQLTDGSFSFSSHVWRLSDPLEPGETETLTIETVIEDSVAPGDVLVNTAQVIAADQDDVDSTPNNDDGDQSEDDEANASLTIVGLEQIDLELVKLANTRVANTGDTVIWTVIVGNNEQNATTAATGVTIDDVLPTGVSFVSATPSGNGTFADNTWSLVDPLVPGSTASLSLVTTIDANVPGGTTLTNTAFVATANETDVDSTPGDDNLAEDDAYQADVFVPAVIDLEVQKVVDATIVEGGDLVTWTVTVTNNADNANAAATDVTLTDVVPSGVTVVSATPSGSGTLVGDSWTLVDPLAPGGIATLTLVTSVDDGLSGGEVLTNIAYVATANETDVDSTPGDDNLAEDDADAASITVKELIDLELTKITVPIVNAPVDRVQWQLTLTNTSDANTDATSVVVQDALPSGVTVLDASTSGDSEYADGTWTINQAIAPGESLTLTLLAAIDSNLPGGSVLTNVAEVVAADQMDIDSAPANDDGDQSEDDEASVDYVTPIPETLMLSGYSYIDTNDDGVFQAIELPLLGVEVQLTGTDTAGNIVSATTYTNIDGFYKFNDLAPGTYSVRQVQPIQFLDGKDTLGNLGGDDSTNDQLTVDLTDNGENYNFGELGLLPEYVNKRFYLASTPYSNWQYVDVRQSSVWYSFDVQHQSFLEIFGEVTAGNATVTVFDQRMSQVASQTLGQLANEPILLSDVGPYYVQISGDTVIDSLTLDVVTPHVVVNGNQLIAVGTAGDDEIHVHLDNVTHIVDINGLIYKLDAFTVNDLHIGASTGDDTVVVHGTNLDEVAQVMGTSGELSSSQYTVQTYSFDHTVFAGGGGYDYSQMYGSIGNDTLSSLPGDTLLTTPYTTSRMLDFDRVDAYGRGGYDYASLYGTQLADILFANEQYSVLQGMGHLAKAKGFERVDAFGRGGEDTAILHDSDDDDVFISTKSYAILSTSTRLHYTKGFEHNTAVFSNGNDSVRFLDLLIHDVVSGSGNMAGITTAAGRDDQALNVDHLFATGQDFTTDLAGFSGITQLVN